MQNRMSILRFCFDVQSLFYKALDQIEITAKCGIMQCRLAKFCFLIDVRTLRDQLLNQF